MQCTPERPGGLKGLFFLFLMLIFLWCWGLNLALHPNPHLQLFYRQGPAKLFRLAKNFGFSGLRLQPPRAGITGFSPPCSLLGHFKGSLGRCVESDQETLEWGRFGA